MTVFHRLAAAFACLALSACAPVLRGGGGLDAMPLIASPAASGGDTLVVLYSGDGGWAAVDRGMAAGFVDAGLPVVGVNSLRYFFTRRTPEGAAADLAGLIDHYQTQWGKRRVILVGYSFGAAALPAIVPKLPAATRADLRLLALVALYRDGELQFHPGDWIGLNSRTAYRTEPAVVALKGLPMVCVYGAEEHDMACPLLPSDVATSVRLPGGHHFNDAYDDIVRAVLQAAP